MKPDPKIAAVYLKTYGLVLSHYDEAKSTLAPYCKPDFPFATYLALDDEFMLWLHETLEQSDQSAIYTSPSDFTWMYLCTDSARIYVGPIYQSAPNPSQ